MSVRIRLKRFGTKRRPFYRVVVMDSHSARDSRVLDEIGLYHPIEKEGKQVSIDEEKVKAWMAKGATPSNVVKRILKKNAAPAPAEAAPKPAEG